MYYICQVVNHRVQPMCGKNILACVFVPLMFPINLKASCL